MQISRISTLDLVRTHPCRAKTACCPVDLPNSIDIIARKTSRPLSGLTREDISAIAGQVK